MDDYKEYRQDSFSLFDSETAGAILGAIAAALLLYDVCRALIERLFG